MMKKIITFLILFVMLGAGVYLYKKSTALKPEEIYRQQEISQGDVAQSVSANGTLNPVTVVSVGTQVSGRVSKLYVDFNDKVEQGQVLLELDNSLFTAQIAQTMGTINNIQASIDLAAANEARIRSLYQQEYVSKQELDQAVQALKSARAQLESSHAQLKRDQTNLGYSIIRSPVSGVVIDRIVDIGQTVAASFQTPELIKIAEDLSKMQIDSSFAEADIGSIKVGQKARFNVDAFPNRQFEGLVKQIRLNPTVTSSVVTYNVVISVDNPDGLLLPGMTAYVSISVAERENVLLVPNAALRFKPKVDDENGASPAPAGQAGGNGHPAGGQDPNKHNGDSRKSAREDLSSGNLYVLRNGKIEAVKVRTGITDGRLTEIISQKLSAGDKIIVGESKPSGNEQQQSSSRMRMRMF
jgi:HlyD family secretion protein